jgi:hypothetical protein
LHFVVENIGGYEELLEDEIFCFRDRTEQVPGLELEDDFSGWILLFIILGKID